MIKLHRSEAGRARELEKAKAQAATEVNILAGKVRLGYATHLPGQDLIYRAKEREAHAYLLADPEPTDLSGFPFIEAEIGITGETAQQVAQVYVNLAAQWALEAAGLERERLAAVTAIGKASSAAEVKQISANAINALEKRNGRQLQKLPKRA